MDFVGQFLIGMHNNYFGSEVRTKMVEQLFYIELHSI